LRISQVQYPALKYLLQVKAHIPVGLIFLQNYELQDVFLVLEALMGELILILTADLGSLIVMELKQMSLYILSQVKEILIVSDSGSELWLYLNPIRPEFFEKSL
jgi:hypothetical protein